VFCSFHVIEHVTDPRAHLSEAARVVRPAGLAFVATPNASSWEQKLFRRLSPNFDSAHLRVFSAQSLQRLADETGWSVLYDETPEYTSGWLRVVSKAFRKLRGEDEEATAGKYASQMSPHKRWIIGAMRGLSWPLRTVQSRLQGGNEILVVLQRNARSPEHTDCHKMSRPDVLEADRNLRRP
jgi:SAM-dependent methyltransferase